MSESRREVGLAAWLDVHVSKVGQQVSTDTATAAMTLNGLSLSDRQLYLVFQFVAGKPLAVPLDAAVTDD